MSILDVIASNLHHGPQTVRFPGEVPSPLGFRGLVQMDPSRCIACGTCAYVCVSGAIATEDCGDGFGWTYQPGRCTFCARCVDYCPGHALAMDGRAAQAYRRLGELAKVYSVDYPLCPECGRPARPRSDLVLDRAFADVTPGLSQRARLCERCRRRRSWEALLAGLGKGGAGDGRVGSDGR